MASCRVRLVGKLWFFDNFPPDFAFFESLFSADKILKRAKILLRTTEFASQKRQIMVLVTLNIPHSRSARLRKSHKMAAKKSISWPHTQTFTLTLSSQHR